MTALFSSDLQKKLWPENTFINGVQSDPAALDATHVEIPQDEDGYVPTVVNPTQWPLPTYTEEDLKKIYRVDELVTKPIMVRDLNQALITYNKRAAKLEKHRMSLEDQAHVRIAYSWQPTKSANIKPTTGNKDKDGNIVTRKSSANDLAAANGSLNVLTISEADIFWAMTRMNAMGIPQAGRRIIINPFMYEDLFHIDKFISMDTLRQRGQLQDGVMGQIMGFNIYIRSSSEGLDTGNSGSLVSYKADGVTPVAPGATPLATDRGAAIFFHPSYVRYCKGDSRVFIASGEPEYAGATRMNAKLRTGGTISRLSEKGVLALYEGN